MSKTAIAVALAAVGAIAAEAWIHRQEADSVPFMGEPVLIEPNSVVEFTDSFRARRGSEYRAQVSIATQDSAAEVNSASSLSIEWTISCQESASTTSGSGGPMAPMTDTWRCHQIASSEGGSGFSPTLSCIARATWDPNCPSNRFTFTARTGSRDSQALLVRYSIFRLADGDPRILRLLYLLTYGVLFAIALCARAVAAARKSTSDSRTPRG